MSDTEELTMWERISDALIAHNIETYPPATKTGECKKEYVVIKPDGSSQLGTFSTETQYYSALMYVPKNKFTLLEKFKAEVKGVFATDLYPMVMPTGSEMPHYYDDEVKAHMASVMYRVNIRNRQL